MVSTNKRQDESLAHKPVISMASTRHTEFSHTAALFFVCFSFIFSLYFYMTMSDICVMCLINLYFVIIT